MPSLAGVSRANPEPEGCNLAILSSGCHDCRLMYRRLGPSGTSGAVESRDL